LESSAQSALPGRGRIDLWQITLDSGSADLSSAALLSDEERQRAARFATDGLRRRWTCARSGLRQVLSAYAGMAPQALAFVAASDGKLGLAAGHGPAALRFNLSHSDDLALCAVTAGAEIGVDVEHMRALDDGDALAATIMTAAELDDFRDQPAAERSRLFFRSWTMKEALAKAIGVGLGLSFDRIEVGFAAEATIACAGRTWHLRALACPAGFAGAVALETAIVGLRSRSLAPAGHDA
jgi:4'-phosphopantetheinyl transferase